VIRNSTFEADAGGTAWWFGWGSTAVAVSTESHGGDQSAIGTATDTGWASAVGGFTVPTYVLYAEGPAAGVDILIDDVVVRQQL
jgi:hypothetical protein